MKRRKDFLEKSKENGSARKKTATSQRGEPPTTPVPIVRSTPTPVSVSFPEQGVSVGRPAKPSRTSAPGSIPRLQLREVEEKEAKEKEEAAAKAEMDLARYIAKETVKDPKFNTDTLSDRARKARQWLRDREAVVAAVDAGDGTAKAEQNKVSRLFSEDYLNFPGAICVETHRDMMDAAMEDAKARLMLVDDRDADARRIARRFFMQKERVLNKTKVWAFASEDKRTCIPFVPSSSVTVQMMLQAGSRCLTEHKYIDASSIQTRARSKGKRPVREGVYDGVVENPPSCSADFGGYFKS